MHLLFGLIVIAMLLALPAIPSFLEIRVPEDDERLHITGQYVRDPRWFGRAFRAKLATVVAEARGNRYGRGLLQMRSEEAVNWAPDLHIPAGERLRGIGIGERVTVGHDAGIRDAYALEHLSVERNVIARTLTSDATMELQTNVTVLRWLDAGGDVTVAAESDLGRSASTGTRITLGENVRFERVWGAPVVSSTPANAPFAADAAAATIVSMQPREAARPVIVLGAVRVSAGSVLAGDLKAHGDIYIEPGVRIAGNVIARGDLTLAAGVSVGGHLFSEGTIRLGPGSRVSRAGVTKTVYATGAVIVADGVEVFGWIVAENGGRTL